MTEFSFVEVATTMLDATSTCTRSQSHDCQPLDFLRYEYTVSMRSISATSLRGSARRVPSGATHATAIVGRLPFSSFMLLVAVVPM